jgi:hypothetical protein
MTAVVAGLLPVVIVGVILVGLGLAQACIPGGNLNAPWSHPLIGVLAVLGSGDPRQGLITMGATSSLVGMLFDTYTFYHGRPRDHR